MPKKDKTNEDLLLKPAKTAVAIHAAGEAKPGKLPKSTKKRLPRRMKKAQKKAAARTK